MLTQLPDGWVTRKLGEVVELSQGLAINVKTKHLLVKAGIPLLRITDLINNMQIQFIDANNAPTKCIANIGDVIYTRTGQVGLVFNNRYGVLHNNCFKVTPSIDNLDRNYLYWFLSQTSVYELANSMASGSVQKDLPHSAFKTIYINLPPLTIQQKIASILSTINEQIDINHQINKKLEEIAQSIFKQWFIDFNFPNENGAPYKYSGGAMIDSEFGEIPKGWQIVSLGQFIKFVKGKKPKLQSNKRFINSSLYLTIDVLQRSTSIFCDSTKMIISDEFNILMVMDGASSGDVYRGVSGVVASTLAKIEVSNTIYLGLVYLYLKYFMIEIKSQNYGAAIPHLDKNYVLNLKYFMIEIKSQNYGAAIPHLDKNYVLNMKLALPCESLIIKVFSQIDEEITKLIHTNTREIATLINIRDSLLPKLMSGEIDMAHGA